MAFMHMTPFSYKIVAMNACERQVVLGLTVFQGLLWDVYLSLMIWLVDFLMEIRV